MLRFVGSKDKAFELAESKAQQTGSEHRVVEVNGRYAVSTEKSISFFYPDALGWNFYPIY